MHTYCLLLVLTTVWTMVYWSAYIIHIINWMQSHIRSRDRVHTWREMRPSTLCMWPQPFLFAAVQMALARHPSPLLISAKEEITLTDHSRTHLLASAGSWRASNCTSQPSARPPPGLHLSTPAGLEAGAYLAHLRPSSPNTARRRRKPFVKLTGKVVKVQAHLPVSDKWYAIRGQWSMVSEK